MSAPTDFERLRDLVYAKQTRIKATPDLDIRDAGKDVEVFFQGQWQPMTHQKALELWKYRETAIRNAELDPFKYGYESSIWDFTDWVVCNLRVKNPNVALEVLALGGNGCLDGGTILKYNVKDKGGRIQTEKFITLERLYERFNGITRKGSGFSVRKQTIGSDFYVPSVNDQNQIFMNRVDGVVKTGSRQCFKLTTRSGQEIVATSEHKFYTGSEYVTLSDLRIGSVVHIHNNTRPEGKGRRRPKDGGYMEIMIKYHPIENFKVVEKKYFYCRVRRSRLTVEAAMNGLTYPQYLKILNGGWTPEKIKAEIKTLPKSIHVHHRDENKRNDVLDNLEIIEGVEHNRTHGKKNQSLKFISVPDIITSIESAGERETYDIQCPFPDNNYVANKFVVHNSAKSYFGISRMMRCGIYNGGWLIWNFTTDELKSKTVMQQIAYKYLPLELRPDDPNKKIKRNRDQHIIFKNASGFTDNKIGLPSPPTQPGQIRQRGSVIQFRYHSAELDTLTGPRPQFAYSDEEITLPWVEAITNRLHTASEKATVNIPLFQELLAQKKANPSMQFPKGLVHLLYLGVHLITFTPEHGYNSVVHSFTKDATTIHEVDAELLPIKDEAGTFMGYEKVPKYQKCKLPHRAVVYFHPYENPFGGNWEGMKIASKTKTRENILWWAYGIASKKSHVLFPKFSRATHVRKHADILKACAKGTWWMVVDPAPGRNMFCLWVKVNPLGEIFVVREWPQEDDFIPGHGYLGPWAVEGQKLDGDKGPAQNPLGMGYITEADEFKRVERELGSDEEGGPIKPLARIIDSRTGNTPTMADSETRTLIQLFETQGLDFDPAGKESGAKDGDTKVEESTKLVNGLLDYDDSKISRHPETGAISFLGRAPRLYVSERCTNTIFSLSNWTNHEGQKGACKDPIDCLRYLAQSDPYHREQLMETEQQYSGVY